MKAPKLLVTLTNKYGKKTFIWGITFFIIFSFISSSIQLSSTAQNVKPAAEIYYTDPNGAMDTITLGGTKLIVGHYPDDLQAKWEAGILVKPIQQGALSTLGQYTDALYQEPPASGIVWATNEFQKIKGFESMTAYAQTDPGTLNFYYPGLGYNTLRPVMVLWQWIRDIVYFIFIIMMVIIAFMILFRTSLGGQTLVTLANSLPSVMWAILLVTLSYPLSGLAIDFIYIGSGFMQSIFITGPNAPGSDLVTNNIIFNENQNDIYYLQPDDEQMSLWSIWGTSDAGMCSDADCTRLSIVPEAATSGRNVLDWASAVTSILSLVVSNLTSGGGSKLVTFLLAMATLQAGFKLFMGLLKEYAVLIFLPIFSPIILMTAAFPGRTWIALTNFVKSLLKSSLSFVGVYAVFLFMIIIGRSGSFSNGYQSISKLNFTPPLLGYSPDQLTGGTNVIPTILIFLLFMMTPTIPDFVGSLIKPPSLPEFVKQTGRNAVTGFTKPIGIAKGAKKLLG